MVLNMFSEHVQSRAEQRLLSREKVLRAAEQLFREQGFEDTTIRQIAGEAGLSVGSVMAVGDKQGLLLAIFDGWIDAVHSERDGSPAPASSGDLVADVLSLFEPFVDYFARDRDLSRAYAATIVRGKHDTPIFQDLGRRLTAEIAEALAGSGCDSDTAATAARTIYFTYLGVLMTVSNGAIPDEVGAEQFAEAVGFIADRIKPDRPLKRRRR